MSLPTVFETCVPREDVLKGTIAEADFAADLAKVIRGNASDDHQKPDRFLANTYPTQGLKSLLRNVLARAVGVDLDKDIVGSLFDALEKLRRLAFTDRVEVPEQLELWNENAK